MIHMIDGYAHTHKIHAAHTHAHTMATLIKNMVSRNQRDPLILRIRGTDYLHCWITGSIYVHS